MCIRDSDYNFQKEAWSRDIARIEDGGERCEYLSLRWFCCFFPSLLSSELALFFTEPKLNASFRRRRLRKSREWARYDSYNEHSFSISEWPLQMPPQEAFSLLSTLAESFAVVQQPTSNHFQCNFEFKANISPIRSEQSDPGFVNGSEIGFIHS